MQSSQGVAGTVFLHTKFLAGAVNLGRLTVL
jgi:hypothetical protein